MQFQKNYYLLHKWQNLIEEHEATDLYAQFMCSKKPLYWIDDAVELVVRGTHAHYHGLMTCGGVWGCPVCAAERLQSYYYKVLAACRGMVERGYKAVMVTYTIPHRQQNSCSEVLTSLEKIWRNFNNQQHVLRENKQYGFGGNIKALECTYGNNGWHWHYHIIEFYNNLTPAEADELEKKQRRRWYESCLRIVPQLIKYYANPDEMLQQTASHGVHYSRTHTGSIRLTDDPDLAAKYICDAAKELTAQQHKGKFTGHGNGWHMTPLELLQSDNKHFNDLYFEYVRAAKHRHRVYISPYVRRRCGVNVNELAEKIRAEIGDKKKFTPPRVVVRFSVHAWSEIITIEREQKIPLRAILLVSAVNGGAGAVIRLCNEYKVTGAIEIPEAAAQERTCS